jgi:hypothetical protein
MELCKHIIDIDPFVINLSMCVSQWTEFHADCYLRSEDYKWDAYSLHYSKLDVVTQKVSVYGIAIFSVYHNF